MVRMKYLFSNAIIQDVHLAKYRRHLGGEGGVMWGEQASMSVCIFIFSSQMCGPIVLKFQVLLTGALVPFGVGHRSI